MVRSKTRIAFLADQGVTQIELTAPWNTLQEAEYLPVLVCPGSANSIQAQQKGKKARDFAVDLRPSQVDTNNYMALIVPGGDLSVESLIADKESILLVKSFIQANALVALLGEAKLLLDCTNINESQKRKVITANGPEDLPGFCGKILQELVASRRLASMIET